MAKQVTVLLLLVASTAAAFLAGRLAGDGAWPEVGIAAGTAAVCAAAVGWAALSGRQATGCGSRTPNQALQQTGAA